MRLITRVYGTVKYSQATMTEYLQVVGRQVFGETGLFVKFFGVTLAATRC